MTVRPYRAADRGAVRTVCIRTGDAGRDATGTTVDDSLLPDTFVLPYVEFAPELAFVADHEEGAAGYVVGVPDTTRFVDWYRSAWLPRLTTSYARLTASDDPLVVGAFTPERMLLPMLDEYPAHLHINLLPVLQRRGLGRGLIERECAELAAAGATGVHLGVSPANAGALAFYPGVGFTPVWRDEGQIVFGRALG